MSKLKKKLEKQKRQIETYYNSIIAENYIEEPVDVWTFMSDPHYLGGITRGGEDIYPAWRHHLKEMFSDNSKTLVVLTGSTGTGKSTIALYALLYIQYRLMILKDPWDFFSLAYSGQMSISFFNLNRTLGASRGYGKMQMFMAESPWFRKHASLIRKARDKEELDFKLVKYLLASPATSGFGIVGEDIVAGILDEVDSPGASEVQKTKILETYNATQIRFKNRFVKNGFSLGKLFIVSSKQDELSFIDTFIAERKNLPEVYIVDMNVWEAKPQATFSGVKFPVAIGDAYNPPKIIENDERLKYQQEGYEILDVPEEFKTDFQLDIVRSLRDIAGITVAGLRKSKLFSSEKFITQCLDLTKLDPVKVPTIHVGLEKQEDLIWHMDLDKIRTLRHIPRCIHLDISFSQDASGLAMSGIVDWQETDIQNPDGTFRKEMVPIVETDFVMRLKAKDGDRIPIHKIRKFILDLKAAGFNIHKFTADLLLASEDTLQLLKAAGINAEYFSLNKTSQPYFDFRNLVYEGRWRCHKQDMLLFELTHLEQSALDGKIDHPDKVPTVEYLNDGGIKEVVMVGSKDLADAVAGSVVQCVYEKKVPMNVKLLKSILDKTSISSNEKEEDITKLTKTMDGTNIPIIGTKEGPNVNKINDIFKRFHQR